MVKHIVMWHLAAGDDRPNSVRVEEIRNKADKLLAPIPGVLRVEVLENYKPGGRDLALYMELETPAAEEAYQVHPNHRTFQAFIKGKVNDRAVLDALSR